MDQLQSSKLIKWSCLAGGLLILTIIWLTARQSCNRIHASPALPVQLEASPKSCTWHRLPSEPVSFEEEDYIPRYTELRGRFNQQINEQLIALRERNVLRAKLEERFSSEPLLTQMEVFSNRHLIQMAISQILKDPEREARLYQGYLDQIIAQRIPKFISNPQDDLDHMMLAVDTIDSDIE